MRILYQLHKYHLSDSGGLRKDDRNPYWPRLSPPAGLDSVSKAPKQQPPGSPQRPPPAANGQDSWAKLQSRWIQNRENVNPAKQTVGRVRTSQAFSLRGFEMLASNTNCPGPQPASRNPPRGEGERVCGPKRAGEFYTLRGFPSAGNWVHSSPTVTRCRL